jgi:hypothetical protein
MCFPILNWQCGICCLCLVLQYSRNFIVQSQLLISSIALLQVARSFVFNQNVQQINLPRAITPAPPPPGLPISIPTRGTIAGWGQLRSGAPLSASLQRLDQAIWNTVEACSSVVTSPALDATKLCSFARNGAGNLKKMLLWI